MRLIYMRFSFTFKSLYNQLLWIKKGIDLKAFYLINYFEISIKINSN